MHSRPTIAIVDLGAIRHNLAEIARCIGGAVQVLAIVKADGYGHGAAPVARACVEAGAKWLGVATVDEGAELRLAGVEVPILLLGATLPAEAEAVCEFALTPTISTMGEAAAFQRECERRRQPLDVQVKIDTGIGRIGVWHEQALHFCEQVSALPALRFGGVWTHFAMAEAADQAFTREQVRRFDDCLHALRARGGRFVAHAANSAALIDLPESRYDLVRAGIILYGAYPSQTVSRLDLQPTMTLQSRITLLKRVPTGRALGYGLTYAPARDTTVATVPAGYVDGVRRAASNQGCALVGGVRCPIVGRVSMDQCLLDVGAVPTVVLGDEAVFFGRAATGHNLTLDEVARTMETIPHEVLCGVGRRVPRVYNE